jgi:short-subunit dehydrogenase
MLLSNLGWSEEALKAARDDLLKSLWSMDTQNCAADFKDASGGYSMPVADLSISEAKKIFDLNV